MTFLNIAAPVEATEKSARDSMVIARILPAPTPVVREQLARLGVIVDAHPVACRIEKMPNRWELVGDWFNHRAYFLLDRHGVRRFACFWKSCGYEPDHGSIRALEPDFIARQWDGEGSLWYAERREFRATWDCIKCGGRMHYCIDAWLEDLPVPLHRLVKAIEDRFKVHACTPSEHWTRRISADY